MTRQGFDIVEYEKVEWIKKTFNYDVDATKEDEITVRCRCTLHEGDDVDYARYTMIQFTADICRIMNEGCVCVYPLTPEIKWRIINGAIFYDENNSVFDPVEEADYEKVRAIEYIIERYK